MKKSYKKVFNCIILIIVILTFIYIINSYFNKSLKEGVVFTPYDNKKLFTKPWDRFCINPPPSCNKNFFNGSELSGIPMIGCNCEGIGNAGNLDPKCDGNEDLYFFS